MTDTPTNAPVSDYSLDHAVPLPVPSKYPFAEMSIGDSFSIDYEDYHRVTSAACDYGKRHGVKFTTRTTKNECRIWRKT